ncbi:differentially expressed in FDCP 8 homolog isoform X2 [Amphibalanus amphitrite]|uniref:differentially expressed in FDCP 8 homolog isoform X2 n=1 Tax=Amphibalanus amphitrite TaxID=1232801 RepID=UPI001C901032|nr:differentially expressed in FDCP 8 homolog isoform X2 [Amphibalanus amphitrite]
MFLHPRSFPDDDPSDDERLGRGADGRSRGSSGSSTDSSLERNEFHFGMTTEEEIDQAVAECKQSILASAQGSDERRALVRRLVELRLRRLELRDGPEPPLPDGELEVRGHRLQPQRIGQRRLYCHGCAGVIVVVLHRWYHCLGCGIDLHSSCLSEIHRNCAVERVRDNPTFEMRIKPERGLGAQSFRCADCARVIMIVPEPNPPGFPAGTEVLHARICDYTGLYYCSLCHWNDLVVTPARIVHNWRFDKHPVSCGSREFLEAICNKPIINLEECNPRLFSFLEELRHIKKLREEVLLMKQYFMSCRAAQQARILRAFGERQYFVETSYLYSLRDLCEVPTGELLEFLLAVHAKFARHIREECEACRGKGHICEVCSSSEVLFAFDALVVPCPRCRRVMHQHCYVRRDGRCPRCARLDARQLSETDGERPDGERAGAGAAATAAGAPEPDGGTERATGGAERATGGTTAVKTWAEALEESRGAVRKQRVQGDERGGLRRQGAEEAPERGTAGGQSGPRGAAGAPPLPRGHR